MNIGAKIKEARTKAKMTQNELAERVGISRSYLAGAELGKYNPSFRVIQAISVACKVSLNFFQ